MQVKEIDIDTGKIKDYGFGKRKFEISFLGGPTTPTYSTSYITYVVSIYNSRLSISTPLQHVQYWMVGTVSGR